MSSRKAGPLFSSCPSRLDGFSAARFYDNMMMCLRFLYDVAVTVSWFASSWLVGCKVGSHPVPEPMLKPKTEGRQGRRFTKPPLMPQKG